MCWFNSNLTHFNTVFFEPQGYQGGQVQNPNVSGTHNHTLLCRAFGKNSSHILVYFLKIHPSLKMSASSLAGSLTGIYFRSCLRSKMNRWVPMVLPCLPCGSLCGCRSGATSDGQNWHLKHVSGHGAGHKNTKIAHRRLLQSTRIEVLLFVQLLHLPTKAYGKKYFN